MKYSRNIATGILFLIILALALNTACDRGEDGYEEDQDRYKDQLECSQACIQLDECGLLAPDYSDQQDCVADCLSDDPLFNRECVFAAQDCEAMSNCFFEEED